MTLRSRRLMPGLLAIVVALFLASSAFAQVQITITPTPSPNEIQTNHAAQTADPSTSGAGILVTGALLAASPLTTTVLSFTYPATLTSSSTNCDTSSTLSAANTTGVAGTPCANGAIPPEDPIQIIGATGVFAAVSNLKLNTNLKRVEVDLPGFPSAPGNTQSGSFRITGVRVDMNGVSAPVNASASLSSAANNYLLSTTTYTAINGTGAGIASVAVGARTGQPNLGTAAILTNRTVPKGTASVLLTGGFAGAFRTRTQLSNNGNALGNINANGNSTRIRLTFTGIPTGVTLNLSINGSTSSTGTSGVFASGTVLGSGTTSVTSSGATADIEITNAPLTTVPVLEVDIASIIVSTTAAVTTPSSITLQASMAPFCSAATDSSGFPTE